MGGSNGKNGVTAFDFDIMRGVIIKIATSDDCPVDLAVAADFCPENEYPDEISQDCTTNQGRARRWVASDFATSRFRGL